MDNANSVININLGAREVSQWVKALAIKPANLEFYLRSHMVVEGGNQLLCLSYSPYIIRVMHIPA